MKALVLLKNHQPEFNAYHRLYTKGLKNQKNVHPTIEPSRGTYYVYMLKINNNEFSSKRLYNTI
jgi:hypothetical protein